MCAEDYSSGISTICQREESKNMIKNTGFSVKSREKHVFLYHEIKIDLDPIKIQIIDYNRLKIYQSDFRRLGF